MLLRHKRPGRRRAIAHCHSRGDFTARRRWMSLDEIVEGTVGVLEGLTKPAVKEEDQRDDEDEDEDAERRTDLCGIEFSLSDRLPSGRSGFSTRCRAAVLDLREHEA